MDKFVINLEYVAMCAVLPSPEVVDSLLIGVYDIIKSLVLTRHFLKFGAENII